jgi:hypothetical protein
MKDETAATTANAVIAIIIDRTLNCGGRTDLFFARVGGADGGEGDAEVVAGRAMQ